MSRRLVVEVIVPTCSIPHAQLLDSIRRSIARMTAWRPVLITVRILTDEAVDAPPDAVMACLSRLLDLAKVWAGSKSETSFETRSAIAEAERILGRKA